MDHRLIYITFLHLLHIFDNECLFEIKEKLFCHLMFMRKTTFRDAMKNMMINGVKCMRFKHDKVKYNAVI